jgi:hypothetical protein
VTLAARQRHPDLTVVALAPNLRGAQNAAAAGAQIAEVARSVEAPEHFSTNWIPVLRRKCGKIKGVESFAMATRS